MFYVKHAFLLAKMAHLIKSVKHGTAFQTRIIVVFHTVFTKTSATRLTNKHFIRRKSLITRRTFHKKPPFSSIICLYYFQKEKHLYLSKKTESYPQKRHVDFTRRKKRKCRNSPQTNRNKPLKTKEKRPKTRQKAPFCFAWNNCGQLFVSRETYENGIIFRQAKIA